ncbi:MAG: hypothetical protein U0174_14070 [Polyangiaceae bacterium]
MLKAQNKNRSHTGTVVAADEIVDGLRALVGRQGLSMTAVACEVSPQSVTAILARMPVRRGTLHLVLARIVSEGLLGAPLTAA